MAFKFWPAQTASLWPWPSQQDSILYAWKDLFSPVWRMKGFWKALTVEVARAAELDAKIGSAFKDGGDWWNPVMEKGFNA